MYGFLFRHWNQFCISKIFYHTYDSILSLNILYKCPKLIVSYIQILNVAFLMCWKTRCYLLKYQDWLLVLKINSITCPYWSNLATHHIVYVNTPVITFVNQSTTVSTSCCKCFFFMSFHFFVCTQLLIVSICVYFFLNRLFYIK